MNDNRQYGSRFVDGGTKRVRKPAGVLEEKGFEAIATDLPGEWASDGNWTVTVQTRPIHGGPVNDQCHHVRVYGRNPAGIDLGTACAARTTDTSKDSAVRRALDEAGYPIDGR